MGLTLALAVSMALVMGGDELNTRAAGLGGMIGGISFGVLLLIAGLALFSKVETVKDEPMPMLELVNSINPTLGLVMAVVIFGMIFNTAIGMYYALAKRVAASRPKLFTPAMGILAIIGFCLSFVGFEALINKLYPIVGWAGILLVVILLGAWARERANIREEFHRRSKIRDLMHRKWNRGIRFTRKEQKQLEQHIDDSHLDNKHLNRTLTRAVVAEIENDDSMEVEPRWSEVEERWDREKAELELGEAAKKKQDNGEELTPEEQVALEKYEAEAKRLAEAEAAAFDTMKKDDDADPAK